MDDYSASDSEMQTQEDPFPGGTTSRPTSLQGELTRLRYQIAAICGNTYWYQDPPAIFSNFAMHTHDGTSGQGPQILAGGIASNAVTAAKILDSNVTTAKIADSNVTTAKIADSNVTTAKIADANVTSAKLAASLSIATLDVTTALSWAGFNQLKILQIVVGTTSTSGSTNIAAFQNSNLSVSITPKISTSKVLVFAAGKAETGSGSSGYLTLARGTTNLSGSSNGFTILAQSSNDHVTMLAYDSPSTTSATTYRVQYRTDGGGAVVFPVASGTPEAVIIAIEVAQ